RLALPMASSRRTASSSTRPRICGWASSPKFEPQPGGSAGGHMRRVVVTGMGIISSIGNSLDEVTASLRAARSGLSFAQDYASLGFRSQVHGAPAIDPFEVLDRRTTRFMGKGAAWNYLAMQQAIADAGLEEHEISDPRTGIIMGSGGTSTRTIYEA